MCPKANANVDDQDVQMMRYDDCIIFTLNPLEDLIAWTELGTHWYNPTWAG
jgi:hypothetical protein